MYYSRKKGFTLVEMIVAVGLFTIVTLVVIGALLSIVDANRKAKSLQSVMNNLNFALESMVRTIRTGSDYQCLGVNYPNCSGGTELQFTDSEGRQITYRYSFNNRIERRVGSSSQFIAITAPEVTINDFKFYVIGANSSDTIQPYVLMTISGQAKVGTRAASDFHVQATASQRILDIAPIAP